MTLGDRHQSTLARPLLFSAVGTGLLLAAVWAPALQRGLLSGLAQSPAAGSAIALRAVLVGWSIVAWLAAFSPTGIFARDRSRPSGGPQLPASEESSHEALGRSSRIIVVLVLVAAILRAIDLDSGLWIDEIRTLGSYMRLPFWESVSTYDRANQHVMNSVLGHWSIALFGERAWAIRLPAYLFGVGGVWALFYLARAITTEEESEVRLVEQICAEGMDHFGYPFTHGGAHVPHVASRAPEPAPLWRTVSDRLRYYGFNRVRWQRGWARWRVLISNRVRYVMARVRGD